MTTLQVPSSRSGTGTTFRQVSSKSIGSGFIVADDLIGDFCFGNHNLEELTKLATYILYKVKRQIVGCGGYSNIVVHRNDGDWGCVELQNIEAIESELKRRDKASIEQLKSSVLAMSGPETTWFSEAGKKKRPARSQETDS